jgi:beta-lactamase regulating signal transducer with metallopeptidase domain
LNNNKSSNTAWAKYLGLGGQIFGSVLLLLFIGKKLDQWFSFKTSIFIWILPLLSIILILIKTIFDTNSKKNDS